MESVRVWKMDGEMGRIQEAAAWKLESMGVGIGSLVMKEKWFEEGLVKWAMELDVRQLVLREGDGDCSSFGT